MHSISMTIHDTHYCLKMVSCKWPQCHSFHSCSYDRKYVITLLHGSIEYLPKFTVLSHQYLKDMFHMPCFQHSPEGRCLVMQDQVRCRLGALETPDGMWYLKTSLPIKWHFHNDCQHVWWCLHQLLTHQGFPCKFSRQIFQADSLLLSWVSPCMSTCLILLYQFLWGYDRSKIYKTHPANTDDLKQQFQQCIQGIPKEMLQCVMTSFPFQLQECTEWHVGHLQSVMFKQ